MQENLSHKENKAGLYLTIIFHLVVVIVLLVYQIDSRIKAESSFVLDFTKQEEIEKEQKLQEMKTEVSKRLDDLIAAARANHKDIKNLAVDASSQLKDDRNTDADQLYKDAERLANELKAGQSAIQEDAREETVELPSKKKEDKSKTKEYSGPSVVSYNLDGRKASHLSIPAYRCYGSGDVTVIITVDPSGKVVGAQVMDEISSGDQCLRSFAVRAARLSRFSVSDDAPSRQRGEIVYRFIAQ
jgi:outer membrane biosynthesis protein TonB